MLPTPQLIDWNLTKFVCVHLTILCVIGWLTSNIDRLVLIN